MKQDLTISEALLTVRAAVRFECGEANAQALMDEVNEILVHFGNLPPLTAAEKMVVAERRLTRALAIIADLREKAEIAAEEARDLAIARAEAREEDERDGMDWDNQ
jgi:hypothetical protein